MFRIRFVAWYSVAKANDRIAEQDAANYYESRCVNYMYISCVCCVLFLSSVRFYVLSCVHFRVRCVHCYG